MTKCWQWLVWEAIPIYYACSLIYDSLSSVISVGICINIEVKLNIPGSWLLFTCFEPDKIHNLTIGTIKNGTCKINYNWQGKKSVLT